MKYYWIVILLFVAIKRDKKSQELPELCFNRRLKQGFKNQKIHINGKVSR
jgi:hypothetical protein